VPVSWDEAFELAGRHFRRLDNPNQAAFYTSGRLSNEATFLYQLFARELGPTIFRIARTCVTRRVAEHSVLRSAPPRSASHLSRCFERSESDVIQHHHRLTSFLKGPPRPSFVALLIRAQPHLRHGSSTCSFEQVSSNPSFQSGRSKWWALSPIAPRPHQRL
jgi:hypothetical protein